MAGRTDDPAANLVKPRETAGDGGANGGKDMKNRHSRSAFAAALLTAMLSTTALTPAHAQDRADAAQGLREFAIEAQPLMTALLEFSRQTNAPVVAPASLTAGREAPAVQGRMDDQSALAMLLDGSGLRAVRGPSGGWAVTVSADPQSGSAAGDGAEVDTLIVTAQKREEDIQDVPIAISAFTQEALEAQKIEGGFDLLKAIPNVTFSKNNFSGYNFSIRGIGTKAISVTTDPGVAVEFNYVPLIRNRLFEQEYFDVERVEVLRGPQGTLHGRNATSGVVNVISAKPDMEEFSGWVKGEVGNYHAKRLSAMVNVPLVDDKLAIRLAGAATQREGYGINLYDNSPVDGRDLWSARLTVGFEPHERLRGNLIWERFEEDDNRARTGKQLCTPDPGPTHVGDRLITVTPGVSLGIQRGIYSQGCLPGSLYDDAAFGAPNGFALPFIQALAQQFTGTIGYIPQPSGPSIQATALQYGVDPYGGITQSRDLRAIYSQLDARYQAQADVVELNLEFDLTDNLTAVWQSAYNKDSIYSTQDFNRYTTVPSFTDTSQVRRESNLPSRFVNLAPGGFFDDPQLGRSDTIVGQDVSRAKSEQIYQEVRLASDFDGPLNFSLGANYLRYRTVEDYYVFFNAITMAAVVSMNANLFGDQTNPERATTNPDCSRALPVIGFYGVICVPIEQNSIANIQDTGHNYFLSRNPYKLTSNSVFGELYWEAAPDIKVTAGLRYTDDKKTFTPIPSQTLLTPRDYEGLGNSFLGPIFTSSAFVGTGFGYPAEPDIKRGWREVTGRLGVDWKPELAFTDNTLVYAFYSRGYKGGGMNPPSVGFNYEEMAELGIVLTPSAPPEFQPEFVNAFEVGAKNALLSGAMVLNLGAFYYDYKDYQLSKIVDRTAQNENFDAKVWGLEIETVFAPTRDLKFVANFGYLDTELAEGSQSIDVMNRTAGHDDWILVKPSMTLMSNCVVPVYVAEMVGVGYEIYSTGACPGGGVFADTYTGIPPFGSTLPDGSTYNPAEQVEANYGAGFFSDLSGHELPNSPHWTASLGAEYSWDFMEGWTATLRGDGYWQSQSWSRPYQLPIDKLHGWYNANLSLWIERPEDELKIEIYAKNILDETPITDAFTNSDDTALTTNIFVLDPRLIGLSIRKGF